MIGREKSRIDSQINAACVARAFEESNRDSNARF